MRRRKESGEVIAERKHRRLTVRQTSFIEKPLDHKRDQAIRDLTRKAGICCQNALWEAWADPMFLKRIHKHDKIRLRKSLDRIVNFLSSHRANGQDQSETEARRRYAISRQLDTFATPYVALAKTKLNDNWTDEIVNPDLKRLIKLTAELWGEEGQKLTDVYAEVASVSQGNNEKISQIRYPIEAMLALARAVLAPPSFIKNTKKLFVPDVRINLNQVDGILVRKKSKDLEFSLDEHIKSYRPYSLVEMRAMFRIPYIRSAKAITRRPVAIDERNVQEKIQQIAYKFHRRYPTKPFRLPEGVTICYVCGPVPWKIHNVKLDYDYLSKWENTLRQRMKKGKVPSEKIPEVKNLSKIIRRVTSNKR